MIEIDKQSDVPIYEQIAQSIVSQVLSGKLRPGDKVPSVRRMARHLDVNPNTIQKSYTGLLENGVLYSMKGKGDFVTDDLSALRYTRKRELIDELKKLTQEAKRSGLWIDELLSTVDAAYSDG